MASWICAENWNALVHCDYVHCPVMAAVLPLQLSAKRNQAVLGTGACRCHLTTSAHITPTLMMIMTMMTAVATTTMMSVIANILCLVPFCT